MKTIKFIYENIEIDFQTLSNDNLMVNATQMAKIFNKDVFQFTRIEDTKSFINACLKPQNCGLLAINNEEDLIISKQKSGTWMHRVLALKFASWLDSNFEVWVYSTIDKILLGHYRELKEATADKIKAQQQLENKKNELLQKYPEFIDFLVLENKINDADKRRIKAIKASTQQLKLDLF